MRVVLIYEQLQHIDVNRGHRFYSIHNNYMLSITTYFFSNKNNTFKTSSLVTLP